MPATAIEPLLRQAIALHRQGALAEAANLYAQVLQIAPANIDALFHSARMHCQQGRFEQGIALARTALATDPMQARAHNLIGGALYRMGRRDEALLSFDSAVSVQPDFIDAQENRANLLSEFRRFAEAVESYDSVVTLRPDLAGAWSNRGVALHELGRHAEALASFERALALKPDSAEMHGNRANALMALERHDEALASYRKALAIAPRYVEALNNCGVLLNKMERHHEALATFDAALKVQPDLPDALSNSGNALRGLYRYEEAVERYRRALALQPSFAEAMMNLGNALQALNRHDEAVPLYQQALALKPDYPDAELNLGTALQALKRYSEALARYDKVIELRPDDVNAKWNKALLSLSLGRFDEGWRLHEHRFAAVKAILPQPYAEPRWDGNEVNGVLLAWAEQGIGDQILHASMIEDLAKRAASLILVVEPRLVPLFARSFPSARVVALGSSLYAGDIDAHIAFGSIGRYLRRNWDAFPPRSRGYLVADDRLAGRLRERLTHDGKTAIGLSWKSHSPAAGSAKSASLRDFAPLLRLPGCRFIDLQYGDTSSEREQIERDLGIRVERLDEIDNTNDLDGLAALISACDAVVTVSNATAHLAGALGTPTWVLVPHGQARIWYWFEQGDRSPWYPRTYVRRQAKGQTWLDVIASTVSEISPLSQHSDEVYS